MTEMSVLSFAMLKHNYWLHYTIIKAPRQDMAFKCWIIIL